MDLWDVLVYGLDCKYDREVRKRGKGSLARSSRERSCSRISGRTNIDNAPTTPVTSTCSPASSPGIFHLAIPPSHLFGGGHVTECEDGFAVIPFVPSRQPQHNTYGPEHQSTIHHKAGTERDAETVGRGSFSSGLTGGIGRAVGPASVHQKPRDQALEATSQPEPWDRFYGAFGQHKGLSSSNPLSIPQGNYQSLPYMPLCSSCQTNLSMPPYPGQIMWLQPPSPHYAPPEYGVLLGEEGFYSSMFPAISIDLIGR